MRVRTPRELGAFVRETRRQKNLSQDDLAKAMKASRSWVIDLEAGKQRLDLGLVLVALEELGVSVVLSRDQTLAMRRLEGKAAARAHAIATMDIPGADEVLDSVDPRRRRG